MVTKKRPWFPGACYHITNRGNNKQKIFLDDDDYNLYIHSEEILDIIDIYFLIESSRDCLNINKNFKNLDKKEKYKLYVNMPLGRP